ISKRSESVFSSDNPFQSGTPYRLVPTNFSQGPATAPVKRSSSSTKVTYYTGSGSSPSITPSLRRRTSTPKIKVEPRTSETADPVAAAVGSSRWTRSRLTQGEDFMIPETEEEEEEDEEEREGEMAASEVDNDDGSGSSDQYLGDDTYQPNAMSREASPSGNHYDDYNLETPRRSSTLTRSPSPMPGEEFTPEEQLSLEEEQAAGGKWASVDYYSYDESQRQGAPSTTAKLVRFLSWILILSILSSVGLWYRQEKVEIGYCGVGKSEWSLRQYPDVPERIHAYLEPTCEMCPPHAYCYPSYEMRCEPSFIQSNHPLSLFGLIPLPATCEPDSEKARRVKNVVEKAVAILREQRARFECRERGRDNRVVIRPEMTVSELKEVISQLRRGGMSDEEFEDLWRGAVPEIRSRDEVVSSIRGLTVRAYRLPLLMIGSVVFCILYIRHRILRLRAERASVPMLVNITLDRLATQAALHARAAATEPWISIAQLRDDVLRDEGRKKRERVWKLVGAVVEQNANVRASVREGRAGDVSRVWEWVGGISGAAGDWWVRSGKETVDKKSKEGVKEDVEQILPLKDETNGREFEVKGEEGKLVPKKYENSRPIF
ncbi:inner nuclear membrane protein enriched at telomere/subtelomere region, partial [Ascosphaera aggregata]